MMPVGRGAALADTPVEHGAYVDESLPHRGGDITRGKPAASIDEYLRPLSVEQRAALQHLRRTIRVAAPKAEECISYGIPTFRLDGRILVHFGAAANHCAFYPGAYPIEAHKNELTAYDTSKGTIRFSPGSRLPATLVRKLVKSRITERGAGRATRR